MSTLQMKKLFVFFSFIFLLSGCDPIYNNYYIIQNESPNTIQILCKQETDTLPKSFILLPKQSDTIFHSSGIGYSKSVYDFEHKRVRKGLSFFSDNSDTSSFIPQGIWKYSEASRCEGNAKLIITQDDIKK